MHATKVQHERLIDEHPHIVIALKEELLTTVVLKLHVILGSKQKVASNAVHSGQLVEASTVHREVCLRVKGRHPGCSIVHKLEPRLIFHVDTWYIAVPLCKAVAVWQHRLGAITVWALADGLPMWCGCIKGALDESRRGKPVPNPSEEVGVVLIEITVSDVKV